MLHLLIRIQNAAADRRRALDERGATAVEYALMVGLIAVGIIGAISFLGARTTNTFTRVANTMA